MKSPGHDTLEAADPNSKKFNLCGIFQAASLVCVVLLVASSFFAQRYSQSQQKLLRWGMNIQQYKGTDNCKNQCRPRGSQALPEGIVSNTTDLKMRPLWYPHKSKKDHPTIDIKANASTNLFAMAVGIKQKDLVDKMVKKFLASDFVVMLFHYDGIVDEWKDFEWNNHVIHVSAANQSKWWFAKRFLHPDIVADYGYIFLWDEDLGVEHFHPDKYISIVKSEGLEISQPALDPKKSVLHHQITVRARRSKVHRRIYKSGRSGKGCDESSTAPPCTGWVEMMAPVFSRAAWRCVWYMIQLHNLDRSIKIRRSTFHFGKSDPKYKSEYEPSDLNRMVQNDLVHAWGLDMQLGYCAQGDRTKNVGVVDAEYIIHYGHPTLGGLDVTEVSSQAKDHRIDVRRLSYHELEVFRKRWKKAVKEDKCWVDPFQ